MIKLVNITEKHKQSLIRILNQREVEQWLAGPPFPYTEKDADEFIANCKKESNPPEYRFAIELDGVHIGGIGLHSSLDNNAWIGYYLDKDYWRKGYGSQALSRILELGFKELNLKMIYAYTFEGNISSQKLLLKHGFNELPSKKTFSKNGKTFNSKYFYKDNK